MTFDDGKLNAISQQMIQLFCDALDELETSDARALVLAGRPGQFCAGFDLYTLMVGGSRRDRLVLDGWNLLGADPHAAPPRRCRMHRQRHRRRGRSAAGHRCAPRC
jgi:enoyl-CoA hydratase/carnithine racemase